MTNGSYRLDKWSDAGAVLEVFRDVTNPLGVGSFDRFAIPRRAYVSRIGGKRVWPSRRVANAASGWPDAFWAVASA